MRTLVVFAIVLFAAGGLLAYTFIEDRSFPPAQVEAVTVACPACHGIVPGYDTVNRVHGRHAAFDCSRCHGGGGALRTTDTVHAGLEWLGIGGTALVSGLIVVDLLVVTRKGKVK